jgi:hypothetical protein
MAAAKDQMGSGNSKENSTKIVLFLYGVTHHPDPLNQLNLMINNKTRIIQLQPTTTTTTTLFITCINLSQ